MNTLHTETVELDVRASGMAQRPAPWTCDETAAHLDQYRTGELGASERQRLLDHTLTCPHCLEQHWWPLQRFLQADLMLEALTEESGADPFEGVGYEVDGLDDEPLLPASPSSLVPPAGPSQPRLLQVGTVLPPVPQPDVLQAYSLFLEEGVPQLEPFQASGQLRVSLEHGRTRVIFKALVSGVKVDGVTLAPGQSLELVGVHFLVLPRSTYLYEAVPAEQVAGLGVGIVRYAGLEVSLREGLQKVGRQKGCDIQLLERSNNRNLEWIPGALEAIADPERRARKASFVLDAYEVSGEHAELKVQEGKVWLRPYKTRAIPVRYRGALISASSPSQAVQVPVGAEVRLGWQLFEVG